MFGLSQKEKRERFYTDMKPFFDKGLVYVVAETPHATFLNCSDSVYSANLYTRTPKGQVGVTVTSYSIKQALENEQAFLESLKSFDQDALSRRCWVTDKETMLKLEDLKRQTDREGPSSDIDVEFEESLGVRKKSEVKR